MDCSITLRDIVFLLIILLLLFRERLNEKSLIELIKEWVRGGGEGK